MSGDTDLQRIARIIAISEANVLRFIDVKLHHLKELTLSLDSVTADTAQRVANLATEVASANAKVDKLIALASSLGATQAQLDAITAIGAAADAATSRLQAEEIKVDAATGATPAAAPAASSVQSPAEAPSGSSSAPDAAA